ncbi:MAG: class I SAM-dependent methyltransferase [Candidatus Hydrogenedentales bacterium]
MLHQSYDDLATDYDRRWSKYVDASLAFGLNDVNFDGHERVLDVACGTGTLELRLLDQWPGLTIHSADASAPMVRQARAKADSARVTWAAADAHALPYCDHAFDRIFCFNALHYFADPSRCVAECARVLAPGGAFWLMDWCDDYWTCKLCSLWLRFFEPAFKRTYGLKGAHALLLENGFKIMLAERGRISPLWGLMRLHGIRP